MDKSDSQKANKIGNGKKNKLRYEEGAPLRKTISVLRALAIVLGAIIGSGIFVSPIGVTRNVQSVGASLMMWTVCGCIVTIQALSYLELALMVKESGSTYTYNRLTLGDAWAFVLNLKTAVIANPASSAIVSLTCAEYLGALLFSSDNCGAPPDFITKGLATIFIMVVVAANCYNIRLFLKCQVITSALKASAVLMIVVLGFIRIGQGHTENFKNAFEGTTTEPEKWANSILQGLYAYQGWFSILGVVEEVVNPERTIPLVLFVSIPIMTFLYVMANVSYFTVMSATELVKSPAVAMTWAESAIPGIFWLMPLTVVIATLGHQFTIYFLTSRRNYVASRYGHMPSIMAMAHIERRTPIPALIFQGLIACCFLQFGSVTNLLQAFTLFNTFFKLMSGTTVIILRFIKPNVKRPYKAPAIIIILSQIINVFLFITPLLGKFRLELIYGFIFMAGAFAIYIPLVQFHIMDPCMRPLTCFLQKLLYVCSAHKPKPFEGDDVDHVPKCPIIPRRWLKRNCCSDQTQEETRL